MGKDLDRVVGMWPQTSATEVNLSLREKVLGPCVYDLTLVSVGADPLLPVDYMRQKDRSVFRTISEIVENSTLTTSQK